MLIIFFLNEIHLDHVVDHDLPHVYDGRPRDVWRGPLVQPADPLLSPDGAVSVQDARISGISKQVQMYL